MEPYEMHKKIQEAIMVVEIYNLASTRIPSSSWDAQIKKGLVDLSEKLYELSAGQGLKADN